MQQSHTFTKETMEHLSTIKKIADAYSVSLRDLLGRTQTDEVSSARCALAHALLAKGLSYRAIGRVINREHSSVRQLLRRHSTQPKQKRKDRSNVAARSETERMFNDMCKRGSAALLLAIFATGKSYRPMSLAEQVAATEWARKIKPVRNIGWME